MEKRNNDLEPGVDAVSLFSGRWLRARLGLQEAGAPFLQTVGTLPGLKLGGSAATDEPLLKLGFPLVHQEELSQQDVSLWGGHRKVLSMLFLPQCEDTRENQGVDTGQIQGAVAVPEILT